MILLMEGIVMSFILLIYCAVGIANGPVGLVVLYEEDVQTRVVELGYTTKEKIRKSLIISGIVLFLPLVILTPAMVYGINGATGFWQMLVILWIMGFLIGSLLTGIGSAARKRGSSPEQRISCPTFCITMISTTKRIGCRRMCA